MPSYDIYVTPGRPADPSMGTPATTVASSAETAALSGLSLPANATVFVDVYARNATGRAELAASVSIQTDADGAPRLTPAPVQAVRATPLAGGYVVIAWTFTDLYPSVDCDHFQILLLPREPGMATPDPIEVPHTAPRWAYQETIGPLAAGRWKVKVLAMSAAGQAEEAVTATYFRADTAGPVVEDLALSVV